MFPSFAVMPFTYTICALVILMSIIGFYHKPFYQFFIYHPYEVFRGNRIHTVFTSAFVHKNWWHLTFNIYIFYGVNRDIEYIILEDDYNKLWITIISLAIVVLGIVLPNIIDGQKEKKNVAFVSGGFSGATFCSLGFSGFYLPLDRSSKTYTLLPFLHYAYEFALTVFLVIFLLSLIFSKSKTNHKLHLYALVIGFLIAIIIRPTIILEIIGNLKTRFN
ncbi:MAG: rhomboid family intramembrane serine protease [Pedobacter sp.]|nr:MAG: rhomboid family intramembrane serine protease [Pedobacter sp.]